VLGGFSGEADKLQTSNSQFKSKFFRLSKRSQSRNAAISKCEDFKFDKRDESMKKSHSETSKGRGDDVKSSEGDDIGSDNNDLGMPKRKNRWDCKSQSHHREAKPIGRETP
jgi:hypothetical protein